MDYLQLVNEKNMWPFQQEDLERIIDVFVDNDNLGLGDVGIKKALIMKHIVDEQSIYSIIIVKHRGVASKENSLLDLIREISSVGGRDGEITEIVFAHIELGKVIEYLEENFPAIDLNLEVKKLKGK
jgi:hypothetical protein